MPLTFEQQPRESNKAFAAFKSYLEQRSLVAVADKLGKHRTQLERWSSKFEWPARVQAHTAHLALVEREATEVLVRSKAAEWEKRETQLRETEWAMHERAIAAAKRGLDAYMDRAKVYANLADIARMLENQVLHRAGGFAIAGNAIRRRRGRSARHQCPSPGNQRADGRDRT